MFRTLTGDSQLTLKCAITLLGKYTVMNAMSARLVQVIAARRDDRFRLLDDQVIHDRQVVRRQIPQHADVVLKQPQVDARRIVVVERTKRAVVDEIADLSDRPAEQEGVVHHDLQVLPLRQLNQLLGLLRRRGERLLDEHVLAVLERRLRQLEMRPDRRDDRDRVDVGRVQHVGRIAGQMQRRIQALRALQRRGVPIAHRHHLAAADAVQVPDDVRAPIPVANHANANGACRSSTGGNRFGFDSHRHRYVSAWKLAQCSSRTSLCRGLNARL